MSRANLFLIPGLLEDADAFEAVIDGLGEAADCTVADVTRSDTMEGLARDALAQAPAGPLCLAGHSMGGYVALEILRREPARIVKLALLNTNARPDSEESTQNRRRLMALAERHFEAAWQALLPRLMTADHLRDPILAGTIGAMAIAVGKDAFARQQRAIIGRADSRPGLGKIACPTLVLAARDDALMPLAWLEEMAAAIPAARLAVIEDCGHMASLEQPEEVTRVLRDWLAA
jgi:pimeloyl-ACP methyl ester carboxylesterase